MTLGGLQKKEDSVRQSLLLSMNGVGAPTFFAFIRLLMSGCACKTWESTTFMHTSPGWRRGALSGSPNFFRSLLALPRTQTTSLRQGSLRLVWTNLLRKRVQ